jgi:His/Glu/Gln/Arg/opine family amino acid ABC transporter permease subunit
VYRFNWAVVWDNLPYLIGGVGMTLLITMASIGIGLLIGLVVALGRLSRNRVLSTTMWIYTEFMRNTPALVKLIWVFYMIPILLGVEIGTLTSCVLALAVSAGAYLAEVFRAGIQSVSRGDIEAAWSLGMTPRQTMWRIVLPQAVRRMLPPFANTFISYLKYSSLVSVLGIADLTYRAQVISTSSFRPLEVFTALAVIYFLLCYGLSLLMGIAERQLSVDD